MGGWVAGLLNYYSVTITITQIIWTVLLLLLTTNDEPITITITQIQILLLLLGIFMCNRGAYDYYCYWKCPTKHKNHIYKCYLPTLLSSTYIAYCANNALHWQRYLSTLACAWEPTTGVFCYHFNGQRHNCTCKNMTCLLNKMLIYFNKCP